MIVWMILFLLIVSIAILLAYLSLRDFPKSPQAFKEDFTLYLIRKSDNLSAAYLDSLHQRLTITSQMISFERLIKGEKSALCIFAPKKIMQPDLESLGLLELEDYSLKMSLDKLTAWEVGYKSQKQSKISESVFKNFPKLEKDEQFWWQMVLKVERRGFLAQLRAVVYSHEAKRRQTLAESLKILGQSLIKVPKPFSQNQIISFYQDRTLIPDKLNPKLSTEEVLHLIRLF